MAEIIENAVGLRPECMSCDVAIVGYGPVGMIFATLLAQYGLNAIVVERYPQRYAFPRAGHFDGETMRVFQRLGIGQAVELIVRPVISMEMVTPEREVLERTRHGESGSGWKQSYFFYQPELEDVINARALELGVRVFMGTTARSIRQNVDSATLTVHATKDPKAIPWTINASYVVGADGAGSFVQKEIGVGRRDLGFKHIDNLVLDFEHSNPDRDIPHMRESYQLLDVKRPTFARRWSGCRWSRWEFTRLDDETREFLEREETCWDLLAKWDIFPKDGKIIRHTIHSFESSIVDKWRVGRALLVGDAAHTMPPFMGQGMCSGIRDAMNLSWKLKAVIAGKANETLLDTYQIELSSHVRDFIDMAMAIGRNVLVTDPEERRRRDEVLRSGKGSHPGLFPRILKGIVRPHDAADAIDEEGRQAIQGRVAFGGRIDRLDEFLRPGGWRIVSRHPVPLTLFDGRQRDLISALQMDLLHVSRGALPGSCSYVDIDGDYDIWFRKANRKAFLQRPDNYVFGTARTIEELPVLLDKLAGSLAASGWHLSDQGAHVLDNFAIKADEI